MYVFQSVAQKCKDEHLVPLSAQANGDSEKLYRPSRREVDGRHLDSGCL